MKIIYTGRQVELAPAQLKKVEAKFAKVGKLIDRREEKEAHVILSLERHLHHCEITVNYRNHPLVGVASDPDLFTSIQGAVERLEKQALKVLTKLRDTKRTPREQPAEEEAPAAEGEEGAEAERKVYRVNHHQRRKPMTLDEAVIAIGKDRDYVVYRDAETDRTSVLVRRRDGDFDLVQA